MRGLIISVFVFILLFANQQSLFSELNYFLKIEGIDGSSTTAGHVGEIEIIGFHYELKAPTDKISGITDYGKRQHSAIIITKEIDKSSPKLFEALCKGTIIKEVVLSFRRVTTVTSEVYYTIKLTNAIVSSYSLTKEMLLNPEVSGGETLPLEEVSFNFEKIQMEDRLNNFIYEDKWQNK